MRHIIGVSYEKKKAASEDQAAG